MPSFYTIFSLFMIFSDIAWEEIINDLEMFELMELQTTNVCRVSVSQSELCCGCDVVRQWGRLAVT